MGLVGTITNLSDFLNRSTGGNSGTPENLYFHKQPRVSGAAAVATIAGRPQSLWQYEGHPGAGAAPSTWANPDNTTQGGLLQSDPGGGRQKWLTAFMATGLVAGTLILYDRLGHIGNLNATTTTAQTFTGTPTRYTDGVGNIAWVEIYTQIGASSTTFTMSYTNQANTSGRTSTAVPIGNTGYREVNRALLIPTQAGDSGIRSIQNIDLLATTSTAGAFGVTLAHPLAIAVIDQAGVGGWRDFTTGLPGLPEILTDACLAFLWIPSSTTTPEIMGCINTLEA